MKLFFTLLFSSLCYIATATPGKVQSKLISVNNCWQEQADIQNLDYPTYNTNYSEKDWIRIHLSLVEQTLRSRNTDGLTLVQKANRSAALDHLNEYWHAGNFPVNDLFGHRQPIFIDKYDNFCAVGYLIKATGFEKVSRKVAANTNYAYVREMNYPELIRWAADYGFTVDELAWIQPTYPPTVKSVLSVGKGTDGEIKEMFVDGSGQKMYIGGSFTNVDSTIVANNIAYITELNGVYTYHNMGAGVNGTVNAIAEYRNKIFVAGSFSQAGATTVNNIAYWDGNSWNGAGCIYGEVKDLIVYNGDLYACGSFDVCAALADINLAKWDSTNNMWVQIYGLSGKINTMQVVNNELVLGGLFDYQATPTNIAKMDGANGFITYANTVDNEVMDVEEYKGNVYVTCNSTVSDSNLILKLSSGNSWEPIPTFKGIMSISNSFNTLCVDNDTFLLGGDFKRLAMVGNPSLNAFDISYFVAGQQQKMVELNVDSTVNKLVVFKGNVFLGGKFKSSYWFNDKLNSIAMKNGNPVGIKDITDASTVNLKVYPNPSESSSIIIVENDIDATVLIITDMMGREALKYTLKGNEKEEVNISEIAAGNYVIQVVNVEGKQQTAKFIKY